MPVKKLTKKFLLSVQPQGCTVTYYDQTVKGFVCRVYPTGRISYFSIFKIGKSESRQRIYRHIGIFPNIQPQDARKICQRDQLEVAYGINPLDKFKHKTKNNNDFCHYIDRFITEHVSTKKKETIIFYNKIIKLHVLPHFKNRVVAEIRQSDILQLKKKMDSIKTTYNRTHAVLSKFFNFCIMYQVIQNNPMKGISKYKENRRTGRISPEEYRHIISSIYSLLNKKEITKVAASALLFLIFTGCRVGECLSCKWEYVDLKNDVIHLPDSKCGAKSLYIGDNLKRLLQTLTRKNSYVFPAKYGEKHIVNIYKPCRAVLENAGLAGKYVIHELRHGFISTGINNNVATAAVQAAVSHKSIITTNAYSHHAEELGKEAAGRIENIIARDSTEDISRIMKAMR